MKDFSERDVRRHYDLLQHDPELGLTELRAMDGANIIGIGLFDNEEDFVLECERYNGLGELRTSVNPRSLNVLDDYGGLKNKMRTLFTEVTQEEDIAYVTGVALPGLGDLTEDARRFRRDVSALYGREVLFPLDEPIEIAPGQHGEIADKIAEWFFGESEFSRVLLAQFTNVMGTALQEGGWFRRRTRFGKYRPYVLEGITAQILSGLSDGDSEADE